MLPEMVNGNEVLIPVYLPVLSLEGVLLASLVGSEVPLLVHECST